MGIKMRNGTSKLSFFQTFCKVFTNISGGGRDLKDYLEGYMEGIWMVGEGEAGYGKLDICLMKM